MPAIDPSTLKATTLTGTLSTAAQPNVTSVGTLTSLTVSGTSALAAVTATTLHMGGTNAKLNVVATTGEIFRADAAGGAARIVADQTGVTLSTVNVVTGGLTVTVGTTAVQALTAATGVFTGAVSGATLYSTTAAGKFAWLGRSVLTSTADGVVQLTNNAETDFSRLTFGGSGAGFPALKRSSTFLLCRLADDSGYAPFAAKTIHLTAVAPSVGAGEVGFGATTQTTVGAAGGASALPATPSGYLIINVAGTNRVIPYYAAS